MQRTPLSPIAQDSAAAYVWQSKACDLLLLWSSALLPRFDLNIRARVSQSGHGRLGKSTALKCDSRNEGIRATERRHKSPTRPPTVSSLNN